MNTTKQPYPVHAKLFTPLFLLLITCYFASGTIWSNKDNRLYLEIIGLFLYYSLAHFIASIKKNNGLSYLFSQFAIGISLVLLFFSHCSYFFYKTSFHSKWFWYGIQNFSLLYEDIFTNLLQVPFLAYTQLILFWISGYFFIKKLYKGSTIAISWKDYLYNLFFLSLFFIISYYTERFFQSPIDFGTKTETKNLTSYFHKKNGYNLSHKTRIILIILESVSSKYLPEKKLDSFFNQYPRTYAKHFFVPTPHSSSSLYSILTGNYPSHYKSLAEEKFNPYQNIPASLNRLGYKSYFLYSGVSHFEGVHSFLSSIGVEVYDKEFFLKLKKYKSFPWGVDDIALVELFKEKLKQEKNPSFYMIGLSNSHYPYFNPEPAKYNQFDNEDWKGRYQNTIEYSLDIVRSIVDLAYQTSGENLIFLLSDHGESFGEHGMWRHDFSLYNEEVKVPMMILFPKKIQPTFIPIGSTLDIYPSILDILNIPESPSIYGESLWTENRNFQLKLVSWGNGEYRGTVNSNSKTIHHIAKDKTYKMDLNDE